MPSTSKKQHNLMAMVANNPAAAKRMGIKQSVGEDFMKADKGRKFKEGGLSMKKMTEKEFEGSAKDTKQDKKLAKKHNMSFDAWEKSSMDKKHDKQQSMKGLKSGGVAKTVTKEMEYDYKTGKKSFAGSTAAKDAHAEKEGKRVAKDLAFDKSKKPMGFKAGGVIASPMGKVTAGGKRPHGEHTVQTKGHTKGKVISMRGAK